MNKIRPARKGETASQKEIWKLSFGDKDKYIDFYYANRYKEEETILLEYNGNILAMLTLMPVKTIVPDSGCFDSVMIYAMATHPNYWNQGFASRVMEFSDQHLSSANKAFSVLVPQGKSLFNFYRKHGYQEAFYIRENLLALEEINLLPDNHVPCTLSANNPDEYNVRRNKYLRGRLHIAYSDKDVRYQQKLSRWSGADIYLADFPDVQCCAVTERISAEKVLIKEILAPEGYIPVLIRKLAQQVPAQEYLVRTPAYLGEKLGGSIQPFGMLKMHKDMDMEINQKKLGYMGLAFD
ncbi:MAG: hypothetical protein AWM53_01012 [Candidatus Dichloromethanomonas elyunquensis]|nr:MAG: hypothetical protein AWM53_01012 [Candidatus Dichloromethanomonas elyunquensis]